MHIRLQEPALIFLSWPLFCTHNKYPACAAPGLKKNAHAGGIEGARGDLVIRHYSSTNYSLFGEGRREAPFIIE
jgi:hypothetical protein